MVDVLFNSSFGLFVLLVHMALASLMTASLYFSHHDWSKTAKVICLVMIWAVPILGSVVYILSYFYDIFSPKGND